MPIPGEGFGLFREGESLVRGHLPAAVFPDLFLALLAAAVLPGSGRDPMLRLSKKPDADGFYPVTREGGEVVGGFQLFDQDLLEGLDRLPHPSAGRPRPGTHRPRGALALHLGLVGLLQPVARARLGAIGSPRELDSLPREAVSLHRGLNSLPRQVVSLPLGLDSRARQMVSQYLRLDSSPRQMDRLLLGPNSRRHGAD